MATISDNYWHPDDAEVTCISNDDGVTYIPAINSISSGGNISIRSSGNGGYGFISSAPSRCVVCQASVEPSDVPGHDAWHQEQERRMNLLEELLRDVLVNKIDFDALLGLT